GQRDEGNEGVAAFVAQGARPGGDGDRSEHGSGMSAAGNPALGAVMVPPARCTAKRGRAAWPVAVHAAPPEAGCPATTPGASGGHRRRPAPPPPAVRASGPARPARARRRTARRRRRPAPAGGGTAGAAPTPATGPRP